MNQTEHQLSPDTQAILLLCGHFGKKTLSEIKPLSASEYAWLAQWLQEQNMRPADLLNTAEMLKTKHLAYKKITAARIISLLMRGSALALAVEGWTNKGLWIISRSDEAYPMRLKKQLGQAAPPIFYGIGQAALLQKGGLAVVGSRQVDQKVIDFTKTIAKKSAQQRITIISGGARGVDTEAMLTALRHGGTAVGVLAERLTRAAVAGQYREALREERLALISPFDPDAGFNVSNAMARNKYIYTLSDWAVVANSAYQEGGTWAGATENFKAQWVPLFVRKDEQIPVGNQELLKQGAIAIDKKQLQTLTDLRQQFSQLSDTPQVDDANKTKDLFEVVWPYVEQELVTEKTEKVLAERLNLHSTQLKIWLKRALELDKIKKLKKPVRYIINTDSQKKDEQETLFKS